MGLIYSVAGYDKNDKSIEKEKEEEICKVLGISKARFILTSTSMVIRSLIKMKKIYSKGFDENIPNKH